MKILHNPRCSKSRTALEILQSKVDKLEVVEYLKTPLSVAELQTILDQANLEPVAILRKKEKLVSELNLDLNDGQAILEAIAAHPSLMERPIVTNGSKAVVARPPEKVAELL